MNFHDFCSFFQCYSILAEKQWTKQMNYSSLSLSASLDPQDTLQGGIIVERKKFRQEIPVCLISGVVEKWQKQDWNVFQSIKLQMHSKWQIFKKIMTILHLPNTLSDNYLAATLVTLRTTVSVMLKLQQLKTERGVLYVYSFPVLWRFAGHFWTVLF